MNIWIVDSTTGIKLLFSSHINFTFDEDLVSGLLAALNQFIITQFKEPIESIEMSGLKWVYLFDNESNILFVAADTKDINAEIIRARLDFLKQLFFKEYIKDKVNWRNKWVGNTSFFIPFRDKIEKYYLQWKQAEKIDDIADFYNYLGIFQQIFNFIMKLIEKHISNEEKENLYNHIKEKFDSLFNNEYIAREPESSKITFSRGSGFNIIDINPSNCNILIIKRQINELFKLVIDIIKIKIGQLLSLDLFIKENLLNYIFNNLVLLKKLNLDVFVLKILLSKRTLKALEEAEIRYRHLFELSPFSITILDKSGKIIDTNSAYERLFGYKKEHLVGKTFMEYLTFPPEKLPMLIDKFKEILKGEVPKPLEIQITKKNGELVWVNITFSLINIESKKIIFVITQDIDKSKKAEQKLIESEEKYRYLFEQSPTIIILLNSKGQIVDINPAALASFGYKREDFLNKKLRNLDTIPPESILIIAQLFQDIFKKEIIESIELQFFDSNCNKIWFKLQASLIHRDNEVYIQALLVNIDKEKKSKQRLKESEEKHRGILENIKEGYFEVDLKGNLTFFNKAFCEITGYSQDELLNVHFSNLMDEENKQNAYNQFNKIYKTEVGLSDFQHEVIKKDGTKRFVESSAYLRYDSDGTKIGFYGIFLDITEKKEREQKFTHKR